MQKDIPGVSNLPGLLRRLDVKVVGFQTKSIRFENDAAKERGAVMNDRGIEPVDSVQYRIVEVVDYSRLRQAAWTMVCQIDGGRS